MSDVDRIPGSRVDRMMWGSEAWLRDSGLLGEVRKAIEAEAAPGIPVSAHVEISRVPELRYPRLDISIRVGNRQWVVQEEIDSEEALRRACISARDCAREAIRVSVHDRIDEALAS